jgi:hypothetical protein
MRVPLVYTLPADASLLDRLTLSAWKKWDAWVRPALAAAALMIAGHVAVSLVLRGGGSAGGLRQWTLLVTWATSPPPTLNSVPNPLAFHAWAIGAQVLAALLGGLCAWFALRRHPRPALLGAAGGVVAGAAHSFAASLFTLEPLGYRGFAGVVSLAGGQTERLLLGSAWSNGLAVAALWSPVLFGAAIGHLIGHRRSKNLIRAMGSSPALGRLA